MPTPPTPTDFAEHHLAMTATRFAQTIPDQDPLSLLLRAARGVVMIQFGRQSEAKFAAGLDAVLETMEKFAEERSKK